MYMNSKQKFTSQKTEVMPSDNNQIKEDDCRSSPIDDDGNPTSKSDEDDSNKPFDTLLQIQKKKKLVPDNSLHHNLKVTTTCANINNDGVSDDKDVHGGIINMKASTIIGSGNSSDDSSSLPPSGRVASTKVASSENTTSAASGSSCGANVMIIGAQSVLGPPGLRGKSKVPNKANKYPARRSSPGTDSTTSPPRRCSAAGAYKHGGLNRKVKGDNEAAATGTDSSTSPPRRRSAAGAYKHRGLNRKVKGDNEAAATGTDSSTSPPRRRSAAGAYKHRGLHRKSMGDKTATSGSDTSSSSSSKNPSYISYLDDDNNDESPPPSYNTNESSIQEKKKSQMEVKPSFISYLDDEGDEGPPSSNNPLPGDLQPMAMPSPPATGSDVQQQRPGAYTEALGTTLQRLSHVPFSLFGVVEPVCDDVINDDETDIEAHNNQNDAENNNMEDMNSDDDHDGPLPFNEGAVTTTTRVAAAAAAAEAPIIPSPNNNDDDLAVATAIEDDDHSSSVLTLAEELDQEMLLQKLKTRERKRKKFKMIGCFIIVICSIILALSLGLFIGRRKEGMAPSSSGSQDPAQSSRRHPPLLENLELLYNELPDKTKESLYSIDSPQYRAWDWLLNHPNITTYPEWRKKQIFALATFYYSFEGPNWPETAYGHDRWMNTSISECNWILSADEVAIYTREVTKVIGPDAGYEDEDYEPCNEDGELQTLALHRLYNMPAGVEPIMPPEIGLLTSLKILAIMFSQLKDTRLSDLLVPELIQLPNLEMLSFRDNGAHGTIPQQIFKMTGLRHLMIGTNKLTGTIATEIAMMSSLEHFNVGDEDDLTGKLPSELGLMTTLTALEIYRSSVSGTIPTELASLSGMRTLSLDGNQLSGAIPSQLGLLTGNTWLALYNNHLTGGLPTELGLMTNTVRLRIWNAGLFGSVPSELGLMTNLVDLRLGNDLWIPGPHNDFTGTLPTELWELSHLKWLFLPNLPNLHGRVPAEMMMPNLTKLSLSGSPQLSGTIPDQVCMFVDDLDFDCSDLLCGCDCRCPVSVNKTNLD